MVLTARQQEIWQFLVEYVDGHGYPPTVREIGKALGLHSPSTVHAHLAKLEASGLLRRDPSKPRAIELMVDKVKRAINPGTPLVGNVAAGAPILAEENIEDYLQVPSVIGGEDDDDYVLRVRGDSMIDDHLCDGDFVVIERRENARNGEQVVALLDSGEATLKRFYKEGSKIRLQPANKSMEPRIVDADRCKVQGVVIGVLRSYN
jgi:repressor LexA